MNRTNRSILTLEIISIFIITMLTAMHTLMWLGSETINKFFANIGFFEKSCDSFSILEQASSMPATHRILGFLVDSFMIAIAILACIKFIQLLNLVRSNIVFSPKVMATFKQLSILALAWAIYNPVRYMLLSVITSWHLGSGKRILALAIGSTDLINIAIFSCFVLLTALIQQGCELQQEQNLTI